jgi:hypothetical protein
MPFVAQRRGLLNSLDSLGLAISIGGMGYLRIIHRPSSLPRFSPLNLVKCALCVWLMTGGGSQAVEPSVHQRTAIHAQTELRSLLTQQASTQVLASWAEGLYRQGRLLELGNAVLPWTTWTAPGWRWEETCLTGERLVLATDGIVLVAIREGRQIEFSVHDLTGGRDNTVLAPGISAQHVVAASAAELARKAPQLFPIYYYFAGPTQEIVSSRLLPRAPAPLSLR